MKQIIYFLIVFLCTGKYAYSFDESFFPQKNIDRIFASSTLENYKVENLIDNTWRSWSEGSHGNGIGESFTVIFKLPVKLNGMFFRNGYGQLDYFYKNNRVKSFEVLFNRLVRQPEK